MQYTDVGNLADSAHTQLNLSYLAGVFAKRDQMVGLLVGTAVNIETALYRLVTDMYQVYVVTNVIEKVVMW